MDDAKPLEIAPTRPGHRLVVHSLLNAVGQGVPIAVAIVAVPLLLRGLGTERFGLLTLSWTIIGYASLFDLGLGRALTQFVAARENEADRAALADTIWSALLAMTLLGIVGGVAGFAAAPWASRLLGVSPLLISESVNAFRLLAVGIPFVVVTAGLRGILEAYERFDLVNAVRVPTGVSTFLGPLAIAFVFPTLTAAIFILLVARIAAMVVHAVFVYRAIPLLHHRPRLAAMALRPVMRFGAWITLSNILSPLMSSADRFFISGMLSASVVAYYTAPHEMVTRLMTVTAVAVATSLFPAFARWRDVEHARGLFVRGFRLVGFVCVPLVVLVIVGAHPLLHIWLGSEFADHSANVLRILGVGVLLNALAQVPFAHIQAVGRADLTGKVHLVEVPFYLVLLIYLIRTQGIEGAAIAWTIRMAVDTAVMFLISRRLMEPAHASRRAIDHV